MSNPTGEKDKLTPKVINSILHDIATGSKGLSIVCEKNGVCVASFMNRLNVDNLLIDRYRTARERQAEFLGDETLIIADSTDDPKWCNTNKLRVDTRKWLASKLSPKKYGDKLLVESQHRETVELVLPRLPKPPKNVDNMLKDVNVEEVEGPTDNDGEGGHPDISTPPPMDMGTA